MMRSTRSRRRTGFTAAIAVALIILGGPSAQATSSGTLQAPYESASWSPGGWSDAAGNMGVAAARNASSVATVVASHQLDAAAGSVTYTANFALLQAYVHADYYNCYYYGWSCSEVWVTVRAQHDTCASCRGIAGRTIFGQAFPASPLTLVMKNVSGGSVPEGTVHVSVTLAASSSTADPIVTVDPSGGPKLSCGGDYGCYICWDECSGPLAEVHLESAIGAAQLSSIDYEIEEASTPNQPPTASFSVSCSSRDCIFDASPSSDPDGRITGYSWDFGDGTGSQSGPSVQHRYAEGSSSYVVRLTVSDDRDGTDTESLIVTCAKKNRNKPTTCS